MKDIAKKQMEKENLLIDDDGVLVFSGEVIGELINVISNQREERLLILSGLRLNEKTEYLNLKFLMDYSI